MSTSTHTHSFQEKKLLVVLLLHPGRVLWAQLLKTMTINSMVVTSADLSQRYAVALGVPSLNSHLRKDHEAGPGLPPFHQESSPLDHRWDPSRWEVILGRTAEQRLGHPSTVEWWDPSRPTGCRPCRRSLSGWSRMSAIAASHYPTMSENGSRTILDFGTERHFRSAPVYGEWSLHLVVVEQIGVCYEQAEVDLFVLSGKA